MYPCPDLVVSTSSHYNIVIFSFIGSEVTQHSSREMPTVDSGENEGIPISQ